METVVIDANVGVALVCPLPYSLACRARMEQWIRSGTRIIVPALWDYEVVSALRKQWTQTLLSREAVLEGMRLIYRLPIERILLDSNLSISALFWAERLGQLVAYDAQYLSLTENLNAQFFTSDRKLYQRCMEIEVKFANLVQ